MNTNSRVSRFASPEETQQADRNSMASIRPLLSVSSTVKMAAALSSILGRFTPSSPVSSAQISWNSNRVMPNPSATSLKASHRDSMAAKGRLMKGYAEA